MVAMKDEPVDVLIVGAGAAGAAGRWSSPRRA
jgi:succinate dehydrogenase/fumarate reductase flavoprotein subunit